MILVKVFEVVLAMPQQGDSGAHGDFGACAFFVFLVRYSESW